MTFIDNGFLDAAFGKVRDCGVEICLNDDANSRDLKLNGTKAGQMQIYDVNGVPYRVFACWNGENGHYTVNVYDRE